MPAYSFQDAQIGGGLVRPNDTVDICPIHKGKEWPHVEVAGTP